MKKIIIGDLKKNINHLFRKLSLAEMETVLGGGGFNNYYITANTGNISDPLAIPPKGASNTIRDNKINTIDYSRSIYITIFSG